MKFVDPIKNLEKISQIKNILRWENNIRDLLLFELGINSALRISDLLKIQVKDLFDKELNIKPYFEIKESKTWKNNKIYITPKVKETLILYKNTYYTVLTKETNYIFFHKKIFPLWTNHIWRKMSWVFLSKICKSIWLIWNFWNHSLRKTWGFQARINNIPLELIQHRLNHSSLSITKRYLWITDDEIMKACEKLDL